MSQEIAQQQELLEAVKAGDAARVHALLALDAALANARAASGESALLLSVYYGHPELADPLLAAGATCNLFEASALGLLDRVAGLAEAEPGLIGSYSHDGFTPLHLAAFFGHLEVARYLLGRDADANAVATNTTFAHGVTPLHSAIARGGPGIVRVLLDAGADVSLRNGVGRTPIFEAAFNGDVEAARMLLDAGADPNPTADNGETPLSVALDRRHELVADLLRARGAQG